jgi:uncharacterized protein YutE (UPF0331/DUF86 family)
MQPEDRDAAYMLDAIEAGDAIAEYIVGLRNVLMHEYDEIDNHRIYVIATELVPKLVEQLRMLLPPIPPDPEPEIR